ncbi:hypothetical protein K9M48_04555 [Candidatus Gracilibacteria bacterium]|nr:hypothetical protein [Candidatus Gracilibacteria bacterium]
MAHIGVHFTSNKKIFVVSCASALPALLGNDSVIESWFYRKPSELERFFKENPEEEGLFNKAFAYWIICRVFKKEQDEKAYGMLKRELKEFNSRLLSIVRNLINAVANDIKTFWLKQEKRVVKMFKSNNLILPKKKSYLKKFCNEFS